MGYLYGFSNAILTCLEFQTGKVMWKDRSVGKGSLTYADGRLYLLGEGQTVGHGRGYSRTATGSRAVQHPGSWPAELGAPGRLRRTALHPQPGPVAMLRCERMIAG